MKKLLIIVLMVAVGGTAFAQLDPFMPPNPVTYAQGGAFTAYAEGMNAFFYNPAGFRHSNGELTLTSVGVYSLIDRSLITLLNGLLSGDSSASVASRQTEDPFAALPEEFAALAEDLGVVGEWIGTLDETQLDAAIDAAITELGNIDEDFAASLEGLDTSTLTDEEITLLILESPIFDTGADGDTNLVNIIQAMDAAATSQGAVSVEDPAYLGTGGFDSLDANVAAAKESIPSGRMRVGALAGVAYSGNGLGIGLFVGADGTFNGETVLSTKGRLLTSVTIAGGLSFPIGPFSVGAQIRPTILGYTDVYPAELLLSGQVDTSTLFTEAVYTGLYLGVDAGALYDLGPFTFGVAIKDLLPIPVKWSSYEGFEAYAAGLQSGSFFGPDAVADQEGLYQIPPMKINVGAQFHPQLGPLNWIIDPRVNIDIHDLLGFLRYLKEEDPLAVDKATYGTGYSFIERLRIGAEASFLGGLASARAGFYGDFLTAGLGVHLLFLDINAGVGFSDLRQVDGTYTFKQLGLSFEAALRF